MILMLIMKFNPVTAVWDTQPYNFLVTLVDMARATTERSSADACNCLLIHHQQFRG